MSNVPTMLDLNHLYSRKLLLINTFSSSQQQLAPPPSTLNTSHNNFDSNVVMVLSVLLCAIVCSLGLNSIIRCALRCTSFVGSEFSSSQDHNTMSARLAANRGIKKKVLKSFQTVRYWEGLELPGLGKECVICLGEFLTGERVKIMPKCNHGFHVGCIDKWLKSHSSCPNCRHCLLETCQKILTAAGSCSTASLQQPQEQLGASHSITIVSLVPLQHEGVIRSYMSP
ncbi:RING-H2 finger protein ATL78-like [Rutidosis leptorrhynchoides]|uniref:RING-H2 finger protein ATL78-like n=1 Tax=Rutidosis leptorrhynchoides TaxID=125765 RepID=UPI003A9A62AD